MVPSNGHGHGHMAHFSILGHFKFVVQSDRGKH